MNFFKWIGIPSGEEKIKAALTWEVRWTARDGKWHTDIYSEVEIFFNEEDAKKFANALREAQKVLHYTENINIKVSPKW